MKILIPLLLLTLGVNANEVVYGSKSGTVESGGESTVKIVDVAAGESIEIMNVIGGRTDDGFDNFSNTDFSIKAKYGELPLMGWQVWNAGGGGGASGRVYNDSVPVVNNMLVGPCSIQLQPKAGNNSSSFRYQVSYKITKPSAAGTTTSAPILLPPTQDAAKSWFVKLQVSSDLKAWDDVAPGQFLGSDTARFFRIQTSEQ
ncbi:hypothetical protein OAP01_12180 [Akkermansiaceae bacterium]|nr:hypothetical protein [Akkermansiaceae bacterium]